MIITSSIKQYDVLLIKNQFNLSHRTTIMSSLGEAYMDWRLLKAATSGDVPSLKQLLALDGPGVLLGITPQGNTCLHIASIQGHEEFCKNILTVDHSPALALLSTINKDGETPLLTAVARGCAPLLAAVLLRRCRDQQLMQTILKQDRRGCNALHHAIHIGYTKLALELIEGEPAMSKTVDERNESPLFNAARRNFTEVSHKLLEILDSADCGPLGVHVLHAAVRNGNLGEIFALYKCPCG